MKKSEDTNAFLSSLKIFLPIRKRNNTLKELKIIATNLPERREGPKILKNIEIVKS